MAIKCEQCDGSCTDCWLEVVERWQDDGILRIEKKTFCSEACVLDWLESRITAVWRTYP